MRVAVLSYPMLFQRQGGLQIQVLETVAALQQEGVDASVVDPARQMLSDFDLIHVFSAISGNYRIVEQARAVRRPVVTSPLVRAHWTPKYTRRVRLLDSLVGRLTNWSMDTSYRQIMKCLHDSDHLIALGDIERVTLERAFGVPQQKISVLENGIPARFFEATPQIFLERTGIAAGFVLNVAAINNHKNQLAAVQAAEKVGLPIVLIGPCLAQDEAYLAKLTSYRHVHYLGPLKYDDPLLASAYAAAGVFCLPSRSEVMPLTVLEALAAGCSVVMTRLHSMNMDGLRDNVREVSAFDQDAIAKALDEMVRRNSRDASKASVAHLTWNAVAQRLKGVYTSLLPA